MQRSRKKRTQGYGMQKEAAFLPLPPLLLLLFLLFSSSSHGAVQDFCVADVSGPQSPAGYSCKNVGNVTVDDFVFSLGNKPGNTGNNLGLAIKTAFAPQYAGVNGLDISALRADLAPGGWVPIHSHPGSSELLVVFRGSVTAGFVSSTANDVYVKTTLREGDTMVLPKGLLHFIVNDGKVGATLFSSFNSASPGLQLTSMALFGNNLPSELVEKVTFVDAGEVKRLKALLGGTA